MKKVLVIAGPTAAGKTAFSIQIAKKLNAEIISGDSIQVYRGFDIGSGKVTKEEMNGVKHHLIDILDHNEHYSVADFQSHARSLIDSSDRMMIICGGTGLYLKACLYDYVFSEEEEHLTDPELEKMNDAELYALLQKEDPLQAERLHPNNRRRVMRALMILRNSGQRKSDIEASQNHSMIYDAMIVGCTMERSLLYERINERVRKMSDAGLEEEVRSLLEKGASFSDQPMQGIGYKEWQPYFEGSCSKEEVIAEIQKHSRQFAKRQYTWFNHQMPVEWMDMRDQSAIEAMNERILAWSKR